MPQGRGATKSKERKRRGRTIKLAGAAPTGVKVELGEYRFELLPMTKPREDALFDMSKEIDRVRADDDTAPADLVDAMSAQLDVILDNGEPLSEDHEGEVPAASEVVADAWEAGQTTMQGIADLMEELGKANRPT